jgi:hypothetical protein
MPAPIIEELDIFYELSSESIQELLSPISNSYEPQ